MTFDAQNLQAFNDAFLQVLKAVVKDTPRGWDGGTLVIQKHKLGVQCELFNPTTGQSIPVNHVIVQLSQQFADFKRSDNWDNDWSKVTIQYSFEDPSVDYTATRKFTYPNR